MANAEHGMIAVDKMGTKVLFLNPDTYATEVVIDGFAKTVHELLIVPETGSQPAMAYVPIFGDGIHGRNPHPQHHLCVFDLHKRALVATIDLSPYIAPHTLKLGPDGFIYITCENSAKVAVIDRAANKVVDAIDSGSTNGHRLIIAPDGERLYTENEEDATVSVIDLPKRKLLGKIATPRPLAGIAITPDGRTVVAVDDAQPTLFLIDTEAGKVREELVLKDVPKAAQIARFAPDNSLLAVTSLNSDTVSLIDPSFKRADRDQGRLAADGHGVPQRRIVRRLPGRRLGACHRHRGQAPQVAISSRHRLRVARILLRPSPAGNPVCGRTAETAP